MHFRRRLQYCYQEIEAAKDDRTRIKSDLKLAKLQIAKSTMTAEQQKKRTHLAKRVTSASLSAKEAYIASSVGRSRATNKNKKSPQLHRASDEVSGISVSAEDTIVSPIKRSHSPQHSMASSKSFVRSSVRTGLLHSLDLSREHLRHSHIGGLEEDMSHWDLHHLQVQAPDLSQYESLEF